MKNNTISAMRNERPSLKILFAASEAQPLIKTGGLADVAGSLPPALQALNHDVRLILPAYPEAVAKAGSTTTAATLQLPGLEAPVRLLKGAMPNGVLAYLVDAPGLFDRPGNPYVNAQGRDWPDNADRFALFCRAIAAVAMDRAGLGWQPDVVHCNDWQTGLAPPLLIDEPQRPATLFTIHNLAYQGMFDPATFQRLRLPPALWSHEGLEFHHNLSFIKGGLCFADWLTTVSPNYAYEICTAEFGYGLQGLLRHRQSRLAGILNGIDYEAWNPASDPHLPQHYDARRFELKAVNKALLQREFGLPEDPDALLFGHIGRLVEQKGVDLILQILPRLAEQGHLQLVMLGSGEPHFEQALRQAAESYSGKVAVRIGYDEGLAHRIEAGIDCFLMPSRFEPCGLNQLYSLRYGSIPIVHRTGGLADTVEDITPCTLLERTATGFVFDKPQADALWSAMARAIEYHRHPAIWWKRLAVTGMRQDFSWNTSAKQYLELYRRAIADPAPNPL